MRSPDRRLKRWPVPPSRLGVVSHKQRVHRWCTADACSRIGKRKVADADEEDKRGGRYSREEHVILSYFAASLLLSLCLSLVVMTTTTTTTTT